MSDPFYLDPFPLGPKQVRGRFVVPSGIRCTRASSIQHCFEHVDAFGVVTTKSISAAPRAGYREPIYARFSSGSYMNAVGLANPGAEQFKAELDRVRTPPHKFLLISIFGADLAEFAEAARILTPVADGFELNMSCPHASGYGLDIGQDRTLVAAITREVFQRTGRPVIVKLSATIPALGPTAQAAIEAGACGITVTNTVGPGFLAVGSSPILSNKVGGLSGNAIRPLGLQSVRRVREAIGPRPLIIGMGGIGTAEHVHQFRAAGADLFGVGSAMTGLDSNALAACMDRLQTESATATPQTLGSDSPDTPLSMQYVTTRIEHKRLYNDTLFELRLSSLPGTPAPGTLAGKYFFLCIAGVGEKPFAVFSAAQRSVVIKIVGAFTRHLSGLRIGDEILLRGPYGRPVTPIPGCSEHVLVGGGTGIASLLEIACRLHGATPLTFVLGGRSHSDVFGADDFAKLGRVHIATNDGSLGVRGNVSDALEALLRQLTTGSPGFINCGPDPMIRACAQVESQFAPRERIVAAVEYMTSCGVGVCGKCAAPSGLLSCIDGPFMGIQSFD